MLNQACDDYMTVPHRVVWITTIQLMKIKEKGSKIPGRIFSYSFKKFNS